jgi:hypothetical protein
VALARQRGFTWRQAAMSFIIYIQLMMVFAATLLFGHNIAIS